MPKIAWSRPAADQSRTRQAFLDLALAEPNRFHVIDASQSIEQVWSAIEADIQTLLGQCCRCGYGDGAIRGVYRRNN